MRPMQIAMMLLAGTTAGAATAVPVCTVASGASIHFGQVLALASTPDASSNSGSSFWVNCSADVALPPSIHSSSSRAMSSTGASLPFRLRSSVGGPDLPVSAPGAPLAISMDATNQVVVLHGSIASSDFSSLPPGLYSQVIVLTVEY